MAEEKKPTTDSVQAPVEAAPAPMAQPAPAAASPAPASSNKGIGMIVGVVVLIAVGVGGYGYWNGMQVKSYADKAGKMYDASKSWTDEVSENVYANSFNFDESDIDSLTSDLADKKTTLEKIKADSDANLTELGKMSVPGKANDANKTLKEYYTLSKQLAEEGLYSVALMEGASKMIEDVMSMSTSLYSGETYDEQAMYDAVKDAVDAWIETMEKVTPPASLKDEHEKILKVLGDMSDALAEGDTTALDGMGDPFSDIDTEKLQDEYDANADKFTELSTKADNQLKSLKNLGAFVF